MPRAPKLQRTFAADQAKGRPTTLGELVDSFLRTHIAVRRKEATLYTYQRIFDGSVLPYFGKDTLASSISAPAVNVFVRDLVEAGIGPSTVNDRVAALRACLNWAERQGLDARGFAVEPLPEKPREVDKVLTPHQVKRLREFLDPEFDAMFLVALHTGLRNSELRGLQWQDVNYRFKILHCRRKLNIGAYVGPIDKPGSPKGGTVRDLPMHDDLAAVFKAQRHRSTSDLWVFCQPDGRPWTRRQTYTALANARKACGARYSFVHWHCCRHTYATTLQQKGVSRIVVQALLGHTDPRLTDRYSHAQGHAYDGSTTVLNGLY